MGDQEIGLEAIGLALDKIFKWDRRGVGRNQCARFADRIDLLVQGGFDVETFDHDLDNPVNIGDLRQMIVNIARRHEPGEPFAHERRGFGLERLLDRGFRQNIPILGPFRHDIEQQYLNPGIGKMGGDTHTHDAGADNGGFLDVHVLSLPVFICWLSVCPVTGSDRFQQG